MPGKVIEEGNSIYMLDPECLRRTPARGNDRNGSGKDGRENAAFEEETVVSFLPETSPKRFFGPSGGWVLFFILIYLSKGR